MGDPELATAFQNPKVQAAIMEASSNPAAMMKYMNDPELSKVFLKLQTLMMPMMANQPGMGGMPGGMPTQPPSQ